MRIERSNAEAVGEILRTSSRTLSEFTFIENLRPGLKQPWAAISERLRRKTAWSCYFHTVNHEYLPLALLCITYRVESHASLIGFFAAGIATDYLSPTCAIVMELPVSAIEEKSDPLTIIAIEPVIVEKITELR